MIELRRNKKLPVDERVSRSNIFRGLNSNVKVNVVEDEIYLLAECPAYDDLRMLCLNFYLRMFRPKLIIKGEPTGDSHPKVTLMKAAARELRCDANPVGQTLALCRRKVVFKRSYVFIMREGR